MDLPHLAIPTEDEPLGHCFGCGELNPIGLHLKPVFDGERVSAPFIPSVDHQGWHNVTHGGIVYCVLDEITAYAVLCSGYRFGVTARSAIRFRKAATTDVPLIATSWATKVTSRLIEVRGHLSTADGDIVAEVESSFIPGPRYERAFLWDMDGVIVDSGAPHFESWRQAFAVHGVIYTLAQFESFFGTRDDYIIRQVMGSLPDDTVRQIADDKERRYRDLIRNNARIFPGVIPLLKAMKQGGFKIALGTSAPMENVEAVAQQIGLHEYFDAVVTGEEVTEGKPSPEIYLLAAAKLGANPERCVVFEDSPHGVVAARRAGMKCVAVTNSHPATLLQEADRVVESMEEMDLVQLIRWL